MDVQRKEELKLTLTETHRNLQIKNRALQQKLVNTESSVNDFISEMGQLLEMAEQDPDNILALANSFGDIAQEMVGQASTNVAEAAPDSYRDENRSSRIPQYGGTTGESTGGSARHY